MNKIKLIVSFLVTYTLLQSTIFAQSVELFIKGNILDTNQALINVNLQNKGKKRINIYPEFISIQIFSDVDTILSNCVVDDKGKKMILEVRRSSEKLKIRPNTGFCRDILINLKNACWSNGNSNFERLFLKAEYFDLRTKKIIYSNTLVINI